MGRKLGILSLLFIVVSCHLVSKEYNTEIKTIQGKYLHFSLDDVQNICYNLQTYDKGTIFSDSTLSVLKQWHDKYGIVVSLYIQGDFTINSKYAQELIENSEWLKWGYHGNTEKSHKTDMKIFYKQVIDSIGSSCIIDKCPRIHYFHADYTSCMELNELGCIGFLTCDDWAWNSKNRVSNYYLTRSQNEILDRNDRLYDKDNKVYFVKTDFRLEHVAQRWETVNNLFEYYSTNDAQNKELIIFSHEWCFNSYLRLADSIFSWASLNEYEFDYPENRVPKNNNEDI